MKITCHIAFALILSGASISAMATDLSDEPSLYQRLGRLDTIISMVDDFAANLSADRRVNAIVPTENADAWKENLVRHICAETGGPCQSEKSGGYIATSVNVVGSSRQAFQANLLKTLHKYNVRGSERSRLLEIVTPVKNVSDATTWRQQSAQAKFVTSPLVLLHGDLTNH